MAEVRAEDRPRTSPLKRHHQIARAAADIEHASAGPLEYAAHAAHGARAPEAVDIEGEQVLSLIHI